MSSPRFRIHPLFAGTVIGLAFITLCLVFFFLFSKQPDHDLGDYVPTLPGIQDGGYAATSTQADLDGDGKRETVTLLSRTSGTETEGTILRIERADGKTTSTPLLSFTNPEGIIHILDLDSTDQRKELAISDLGPSSDYTTEFYHYQNGALHSLGKISGLVSEMNFPRKNTLITKTYAHILDTWVYDDAYELHNETLVRIPTSFHARTGEPLTVLEPLPLQRSPRDTRHTLTLKKGDVVLITGCENDAFCLVETRDHQRGWFAIRDFDFLPAVQKRAIAVFDGLSYAD